METAAKKNIRLNKLDFPVDDESIWKSRLDGSLLKSGLLFFDMGDFDA